MPARPQTLRGLLLWYLLVPLGVLWLFNVGVTFYVARYFSSTAFDRSLFNTTRTLAEQMQIENGQAIVKLPTVAWNILYYDEYDQVFSEVKWADGGVIAGNSDLPPPAGRHEVGRPIFHNGVFRGKPVRIASLYVPVDTGGGPARPP